MRQGWRAALAAVVAWLGTPIPAAAQSDEAPAAPTVRLAGVVRNGETGQPIPQASVVLMGLDSVRITNSQGRFDFGLVYPGIVVLQAKAIGYAPYTARLRMADSSVLDLGINLKPEAAQLPEIVLEADKVKRGQFYERLNSGRGRFITRDMIEDRNPIVITDMFRAIPGVRMQCNGFQCRIQMTRGQGLNFNDPQNCPPAFFINGVKSDIDLLERDLIPPADIEGIEIYRGPSEMPVELNAPGLNGRCGAVVLWTRISR